MKPMARGRVTSPIPVKGTAIAEETNVQPPVPSSRYVAGHCTDYFCEPALYVVLDALPWPSRLLPGRGLPLWGRVRRRSWARICAIPLRTHRFLVVVVFEGRLNGEGLGAGILCEGLRSTLIGVRWPRKGTEPQPMIGYRGSPSLGVPRHAGATSPP